MSGYLKTITVSLVAHCLKPKSHSFSITVKAARADFCAAGHWVPGGFGPFDLAQACHQAFPTMLAAIFIPTLPFLFPTENT
jgi:hypothetical protein